MIPGGITALLLTHTCLLGTPEYTAELLQAVDKVNGSLGRVAEWWREREKAAKK